MRNRVRDIIAWGRRLGLEYTRTRASLAAGGLAYFVALSLAPAALAFGTMAGLFLDPQQLREVLEGVVQRAPASIGNAEPIIDSLVSTVAGASATSFTITTLVSALIAVYASSKVVMGVRMAMNTVFGVTETRGGLVERGIAAVITLAGLIAAVCTVILLTLVPRVLSWLGVAALPLSTGNWLLDWVVVGGLVFLSVRWVLHHAPNQSRRVAWTSPGAWSATAGIAAATVGVGVYTRFSTSLGAAVLVFGTAVVILLWLYLCFVALLWGAIIESDQQRRADGVRTRTSVADRPPAP